MGPRFEENFRRALLLSRGDMLVFIERPISAVFIGLCLLLIGLQIYVRLRPTKALKDIPVVETHGHHAQASLAPVTVNTDAPR